jgi:hypothetical protein
VEASLSHTHTPSSVHTFPSLQTALLAFPDHTPILVHYDLGEFAAGISAAAADAQNKNKIVAPENRPRPVHRVLKEAAAALGLDLGHVRSRVDAASLLPAGWPSSSRHVDVPIVVRRDRVGRFVRSFLALRQESVIAVVAHSNVIRTAVALTAAPSASSAPSLSSQWKTPPPRSGSAVTHGKRRESMPRNGVPIKCLLTPDGVQKVLLLYDEDDDDVPDHLAAAATTEREPSELPRPVALVTKLDEAAAAATDAVTVDSSLVGEEEGVRPPSPPSPAADDPEPAPLAAAAAAAALDAESIDAAGAAQWHG